MTEDQETDVMIAHGEQLLADARAVADQMNLPGEEGDVAVLSMLHFALMLAIVEISPSPVVLEVAVQNLSATSRRELPLLWKLKKVVR